MDFLQGISRIMKEAKSSGSSQAFEKVEAALGTSRDQVRETVQDLTTEAIKDIIHKLEGKQPLSAEDKRYVRWWIVGEAEGRLRMEQDFQDEWAEFQRLTETLGGYESKEASVTEFWNLEGLLADAARVTAEIRQLLEYKERITRFEASVQDLDEEECVFLARMLKDKLAYPDI